jgi:hypothetical protein
MSPEAIRRILKSKWRPTPEEQVQRINRWKRRQQRWMQRAIGLNSFRVKSIALQRYRDSQVSGMPIQAEIRLPTERKQQHRWRSRPPNSKFPKRYA